MADATIGIDQPAVPDGLLDAETLTVGVNTVLRERVQITGTGATHIAPVSATAGLKVDLGADNDVTITSGTVTAVTAITNALPAGTNAIGKLAANSGVDIGDVDVTTINGVAPAFGTGARGATVLRVTVATDDSVPVTIATNTPVGNVAHDAADSGAPLKVGAKAISSLATATLVASADRTDNQSDLDGALLVRGQIPLADLKSDAISNTDGASTASSVFTAVASTKNYVMGAEVFRTDTGTTMAYVDFRDGTGGSVKWRMPLPPGGGSVLPIGQVPWFATTANTALAYDVSSALTTIYINVTGFQSKV